METDRDIRHGASHQKMADMQERIRSLEGMIQRRASIEEPAPKAHPAPTPVNEELQRTQHDLPSPGVAGQNSVTTPPEDLNTGRQGRRSVAAQEHDVASVWSGFLPPIMTFVETVDRTRAVVTRHERRRKTDIE